MGRPDPIGLLEEQAKSRVSELVPIRRGRMMASPFTFYRGAALPMASDLSRTPVSGLAVQACGDAHLSNFGIFGSAERLLVFDVNDFDETTPGPWECDLQEASVLSRFAGASKYANMGQRVAAGQRLMQASSDIFLGWQRAEAGLDGQQRDFYVRQLRDWKYSIAIEALVPRGMRIYGQACGWTLARAHARSGDRIAIAAYLGSSDAFDTAITQFAAAYADQNERDHQELVDAVASGRLTAEPDL